MNIVMKKILFIIWTISISLFCSCEDDVEYGVGDSSTIVFSVDTVNFDTVLSEVGSSTQRFKVFNKNDKAVRFSQVRLASGGESGFQVNVDGESGAFFHDVSIYDKDSIFVFVKFEPKKQNNNLPVEVKDSLIFTLENGIEKSVIFYALVQDAIVLKGVVVEDKMVLEGEKPYIVYDSLVVSLGALLEINNGVSLYFHNKADLRVHGRILCNGVKDAPIVFRGMRTDKILPYLPYDRLDGQWGGVHFYPESFENELHFTDIHGGRFGITCDNSILDATKLYMTNSSIHNVAADALAMKYCSGVFVNCEFSNAKGNCVTLLGGDSQFLHCTMAQFYPWDASRGSALYFCNVLNDTIYPLERADFINCLITGISDDEVYGSRIDNNDAAFNCNFINCVVNTNIDDESSKEYFTNCTSENENNETYKSTNFRCIDTDNYVYDFRLDSLSVARKVGSAGYYEYAPNDKDGNPRPVNNPDVGCYQYVE